MQEQAKRGSWDYRLDPVYTVGILDFVFDDHRSDDELVHYVELKNQHCDTFYDKLQFIYIELPKFKKTVEALDSQFEKWLFVFKHLSKLQDRPAKLQDKIFERLFEAAEIAQFSAQEREAYEESLKYYRDLNNIVNTSKEEGRAEGMAEGEQARTRAIARAMEAEGEPTEKISRYTGLTADEVARL